MVGSWAELQASNLGSAQRQSVAGRLATSEKGRPSPDVVRAVAGPAFSEVVVPVGNQGDAENKGRDSVPMCFQGVRA